MSRKKKRFAGRTVMLTMTVVLLCVLSAGVTYAYLYADPGTAVNVITVGEIGIDLQEKSWERHKAHELHPKESAAKDPVVVNIGHNPAYVYLEVAVPMQDIVTVTEEGTKEESKVQELFLYEADLSAWELVEHKVKNGKSISVYGYHKALEPGEATEPLFTEILAVNYLEGSLDPEETFTVEITAKAIQNRLSQNPESLTEIYMEFLNQMEQDQETKLGQAEFDQKETNQEEQNQEEQEQKNLNQEEEKQMQTEQESTESDQTEEVEGT